MSVTIKNAAPEDEILWRFLWGQYLAMFSPGLSEEITASTWARLMDPASPMKGRFAFEGDKMLGFALYLHHPASWVMGDVCYLGDLFVSAEARGKGVGRLLIEDLRDLAKAKGWHRLYWHTDRDNATARLLYDKLAPLQADVLYKMTL